MIVGNGPCAQRIAENLLAEGIAVIIASKDQNFEFSLSSASGRQTSGSIEILTFTKVLNCQGCVGQFDILFQTAGEKFHRSASIIIIAEDYEKKPNFALYDLDPSGTVWSLSQINESMSGQQHLERRPPQGSKVAFLTGLSIDSNAIIQETVMRTALQFQSDLGLQSYIFTGNLKVSANGLETLSRDLKKAGAMIIKFTNSRPQIRQTGNGSFGIDYLDEVTNQYFKLVPDILVVDETICPSRYLHHLSDVFDLDTDQTGFLQTENVHRLPVYTNRKGILAVGPSKAVQHLADLMIDADGAALTAIELLADSIPKARYRAEIDTGLCARCLTCFRLCPHHAISFGKKLSVKLEACEGCGLCAAECPTTAIRQQTLRDDVIMQVRMSLSKKTDPKVPSIVAFCCSRSAARSAELAHCMGHELPQGLSIVEVPCASCISMEYILAAFANGAEGALVLTCHEGNCYSEKGTIFARNRAKQVLAFLEHTKSSGERIKAHSLASNMGIAFFEIAYQFEKALIDMGPLHKTWH